MIQLPLKSETKNEKKSRRQLRKTRSQENNLESLTGSNNKIAIRPGVVMLGNVFFVVVVVKGQIIIFSFANHPFLLS